ncbi:hypothetical protein ACSVC9_00845 [Clostridium sp. LBM24168]
MKHSFGKLGAIVVILTLTISLAACSFGKESSQNGDNSKKTAQSAKKNSEPNVTVNKDKTEQLKKEKIISNGKVYIQKNKAIATMVVKNGVSDSAVKELANKYANELKSQYKNMPVTVMAVRNNKNVVNVTIK